VQLLVVLLHGILPSACRCNPVVAPLSHTVSACVLNNEHPIDKMTNSHHKDKHLPTYSTCVFRNFCGHSSPLFSLVFESRFCVDKYRVAPRSFPRLSCTGTANCLSGKLPLPELVYARELKRKIPRSQAEGLQSAQAVETVGVHGFISLSTYVSVLR